MALELVTGPLPVDWTAAADRSRSDRQGLTCCGIVAGVLPKTAFGALRNGIQKRARRLYAPAMKCIRARDPVGEAQSDGTCGVALSALNQWRLARRSTPEMRRARPK
jgi:hypothetical protein